MFFLAPIVLLTLDLVSCANRLQLCLFNLGRLQLEDFVQRSHIIIELEDLYLGQSSDVLTLEEVNALALQILRLAIFLRRQHPNLVVFVECDVHVDFPFHLL